jgi:hypothetical protein
MQCHGMGSGATASESSNTQKGGGERERRREEGEWWTIHGTSACKGLGAWVDGYV